MKHPAFLRLSVAEEKECSRLRTSLETVHPFRNTDSYSKKLRFCRQHGDIRRHLARTGVGHKLLR